MPSLDEQCAEIYDAEGLTGVNRHLHKTFPDIAARDKAAAELENTGRWKIVRHYSSEEASIVPDRVVVTQFLE